MFLILDQYLTEFNLRLKRVTERKEMKTLLLTSAQIALDLVLVFRLSEQDASIHLQYQDATIETLDINGVYCGINTFEPRLWEQFTLDFAINRANKVLHPPAILGGTLSGLTGQPGGLRA